MLGLLRYLPQIKIHQNVFSAVDNSFICKDRKKIILVLENLMSNDDILSLSFCLAFLS